VSHNIICITAFAHNVLLQHERKRWTLTSLANSAYDSERLTRCWCVISLRRRTNDLKINTISVKWITDFQWFCSLGDFLSWHAPSSMNSLL